MKIKELAGKGLNLGIHSELNEGKKFALRVSNVDAYWSLLAMGFYIVYAHFSDMYPLIFIHITSFIFVIIGLLCIHFHRYDLGRYIIHLTGLTEIFLSADAVGPNSGYEFYYFTQVMIPHITWSLEEQWKGAILSALACMALVGQQILGTGIFFHIHEAPEEDRLIAIVIVMLFTLTVLIIARWKLFFAQKEVRQRQNDLIHSSNLIALGEMSGGIAHEINNPLQTLTLQLTVLREKMKEASLSPYYVQQHLEIMDNNILKMGKMVQGLRDLSRKDHVEHAEQFLFSKILDDVLIVSHERFKDEGIELFLHGESEFFLNGNPIQISQVLVNLLNNAVDAIKDRYEKWIRIEVAKKSTFLQVSVTDSGNGIHEEVIANMMKPFFTTKDPSKGTGLGLSISKSIVEKNQGKLYYDSTSTNTRFIVLLPLAQN